MGEPKILRRQTDDGMMLIGECGEDVRIASTVIIKRPEIVRIGNRVAIDDFAYISCKATFGNVIHAAVGLYVIGYGSELIVEDFCNFSPRCTVICATDSWMGDEGGLVSPLIPDGYRNKVIKEPVVMRKYSGLGTGATLLSGAELGEGAMLGINSFTDKKIPPFEIWVGSPAKYLKKRPKEAILRSADILREQHPEWFV